MQAGKQPALRRLWHVEGRSGQQGFQGLPIDAGTDYYLKLEGDGYAAETVPFRVREEENDLGTLAVREIYDATATIETCRYAAWVQEAEWNFDNTYEIKTIYGVWDLGGTVHYSGVSGSEAVDVDEITFDLEGRRWSYANLDGHVVDAFISGALDKLAEAGKVLNYLNEAYGAYGDGSEAGNVLTTQENLSDPLGTPKGSVVDCGDLDVLDGLAAYDPAVPENETIVRIDDVRVYENGTQLYALRDAGRVRYDSQVYRGVPIHVPVTLSRPLDRIGDLTVRVYLRVQNGSHSVGPLGLVKTDRLYVEWHCLDGKLRWVGTVSDPSDYPQW